MYAVKSSGDIWEMFITTKSYRDMNCYNSLEDAIIDFNLELEKLRNIEFRIAKFKFIVSK